MRVNKLVKTASVVFLVFPRSPISYLFYVASGVLTVDWRQSRGGNSYLILLGLLGFYFIGLFLSINRHISVTAFLLELVLVVPITIFLSGFGSRITRVESLRMLRMINLVLVVASFLHLLTLGFPVKLPYVHYLPDEFFGTYGIGGARILTVLGFFLILMELELGEKKARRWLVVGAINFLVPSYILGIFAGAVALSIRYVRRPAFWLGGLAVSIPVINYILYRVGSINSIFIQDFGMHPKLYGFVLIADLYKQYSHTIFTGTSLGQLTGNAASWSSEYLRQISGNGVPDLPGLFMSEYHKNIYGEVLSYAFNSWNAISSAFNKPYSSVTTILGEVGVFCTMLFVYLFYQRLKGTGYGRSLLVYCGCLFFLDVWHDNLWLGYCLLVSIPFLNVTRVQGFYEGNIYHGRGEERNNVA